MPGERVLIIGGTHDARLLATALIAAGFEPVTSMAGVTREPALPQGAVRVGGFEHAGIAAYIAEARIGAIIDAAHPFAVRISDNASRAAALACVPYLHFERPPWVAGLTTDGLRSRMRRKRPRCWRRERGCCSPSARAGLRISSAAMT